MHRRFEVCHEFHAKREDVEDPPYMSLQADLLGLLDFRQPLMLMSACEHVSLLGGLERSCKCKAWFWVLQGKESLMRMSTTKRKHHADLSCLLKTHSTAFP